MLSCLWKTLERIHGVHQTPVFSTIWPWEDSEKKMSLSSNCHCSTRSQTGAKISSFSGSTSFLGTKLSTSPSSHYQVTFVAGLLEEDHPEMEAEGRTRVSEESFIPGDSFTRGIICIILSIILGVRWGNNFSFVFLQI